jgi:hypothetical protein
MGPKRKLDDLPREPGEAARGEVGRVGGGGEPGELLGNVPMLSGIAAAPGKGHEESEAAESGELRCGCGSLVARRCGDTVELKCRRCRRCLYLRLLPDGTVTLTERGS